MKIHLLFLILNVLIFSSVIAQKENSIVDSLSNVLKNCTEDTSKINIQLEIANVYFELENYDNALRYCKEAKVKSLEHQYNSGFYFATEKISIIYSRKGEIDLSKKNIINSFPFIKKEVTEYRHLQNQLATSYLQEGDFDNCFKYSEQARISGVKYKDTMELVHSLGIQGQAYNFMGKLDSANMKIYNALELSKNQPNELVKSLYLVLAHISEQNNDTTLVKKHINKFLLLSNNNSHSKLTTYWRLSRIETDEKAFTYCLDGYHIAKELELDYYLSLYALELAKKYRKKNLIDSCVYLFEEAKDIYIKQKNDIGLVGVYIEYANALLKFKINKTINLATKAMTISLAKNLATELKLSYHLLSKAREQQGDNREALVYYKKYIQVRDSVFSENKQKIIKELEIKYETAQKNIEIKELAYQNTIALQNNKRQKQESHFYLIGGGVFVFLILVGGMVFIQVRKTRFQNREYKLEQQLLRSQMNPHFMSNFLMAVKIAIKKEDSDKAIEYMDKFGGLSRQVLESSINDFITLEEEVSFLNNYLSLQQLVAYSLFDYSITVSKNIDESELMIPPMLLQPFVENSIKHGFLSKQIKGKLEVNFDIKGNYIITKIRDNGQGFGSLKEVSHSKNKSRAMNITKSRIDLLKRKWNKNITFDIISTKSGAEVIFKTPIRVA